MMDRNAASPAGRDPGLGSARAGVGEWRAERLSAIALIPLTLWFLVAFVLHARTGYDVCVAWLRQPLSAVLMVLLLIALFRHLDLGLKVIIEDYVHSGAKLPSLILTRLLCFAFATAGIVAIVYILLGR